MRNTEAPKNNAAFINLRAEDEQVAVYVRFEDETVWLTCFKIQT